MHDISQYVQEMKIYNKVIDIPENLLQFMYYSSYKNKICDNMSETIKNQKKYINEADIIVVEISTLKYIIKDGIYLDIQQASKTDNKIMSYDKEEFISKFNEFIEMLPHKKILFVGHIYLPHMTIDKLKVREKLNEYINFCSSKYTNVFFFNPSIIVEKYGWNNMMIDTTHYSKNGRSIVETEIIDFMKKM